MLFYISLEKVGASALSFFCYLIIVNRSGLYLSGFTTDKKQQILDFTQRVSLFLEQHQLKIDGEIWELLWQDEVFKTEKELQVFEVMIPIKPVSH